MTVLSCVWWADRRTNIYTHTVVMAIFRWIWSHMKNGYKNLDSMTLCNMYMLHMCYEAKTLTHTFRIFPGFKWSIIIVIMMMSLWNIIEVFIVNITEVVILFCSHQLAWGNSSNQHVTPKSHRPISETVNTVQCKKKADLWQTDYGTT